MTIPRATAAAGTRQDAMQKPEEIKRAHISRATESECLIACPHAPTSVRSCVARPRRRSTGAGRTRTCQEGSPIFRRHVTVTVTGCTIRPSCPAGPVEIRRLARGGRVGLGRLTGHQIGRVLGGVGGHARVHAPGTTRLVGSIIRGRSRSGAAVQGCHPRTRLPTCLAGQRAREIRCPIRVWPGRRRRRGARIGGHSGAHAASAAVLPPRRPAGPVVDSILILSETPSLSADL